MKHVTQGLKSEFCKTLGKKSGFDAKVTLEMNSSYDQADAKVKYNLQFGMALCCKEQLIYDVSRCPFTLKFNESTNRLSDKQYDGYVQYFSESERKVLNKFCGALFLGYCPRGDLVDHFTQFLVDSQFDPSYFFHSSMDGPNIKT